MNNCIPEGFYSIKDDASHVCGTTACRIQMSFVGFRYRSMPDDELIDYLSEKGFPNLDFNAERNFPQ